MSPLLRVAPLVVAMMLLTPAALPAQSDGEPSNGEQANGERIDALEGENAELRRALEIVQRQIFELAAGAADETNDDAMTEQHEEETARLGTKGGLLSKPFLGSFGGRTTVGGYVDLEYRDIDGDDNTFRQHRFIPFIYAQVTDQIRFAAEIEFEDGGPDSAAGDGESKVEFATLDYQPDEALGFRAGAILAPLGKFNLVHDSPVNDLTDRPMVDRAIIPTTFTEAGAGIFGTIYPSEESKLDYELYLVNGFSLLEADATAPTGFTSGFSTSSGIRGGRGSLKKDNNNSLAAMGRVAYSPFIGAEVGVSAHHGRYDDKGDNNLLIWAVDAVYSPVAALEFLGEVARAEIERDTLARASGVPDDMWGFYSQVSVHFMPEALRDRFPGIIRDEATFTAVVRLGHLELDDTRTERVTLGLNFRPIEGTVFKADYQFNYEDRRRSRVRNDGFLFSIASYF